MSKFFIQLSVFIIVVILAQIFLSRYIFPVLPDPGLTLMNKSLRDHDQVLYFGDSVVNHISAEDTGRRSIVEMLTELDSTYTIANLSNSANHPDVYEAWLDYIARSPHKPQGIIIPINLRSFSPIWDKRPEYQFERQKFFFTARPSWLAYFYQPLATFRAIKVKEVTKPQFLQTPVFYRDIQVGLVKDFIDDKKFSVESTENIKDKYVLNYMYNLERTHRKILSLEKTINIARKAGIELFIYITPIDYEAGGKYVGQDFQEQIKLNTNIICGVLAENNLNCLNLAMSLGSDYFDHPAYPNEHLNESGRMFVADKIMTFFLKNKDD